MATRNIVPRATGEGSIGTSAKTWGAVYADDIAVTNSITAPTFTGDLTGTASGNLPLTGGTMTGAIEGNPLTLTADDGNGNSADLVLSPNGSATWNNKEMERIHSIDINDDMSTSPASAYIRYESGLLICFGNVGSVKTTNTWVTFPSAFSTKPRILVGCYSSSTHVGWAGTSTTGVNFNSTSSSGIAVGWIAIGTWK